MTLIWGAKRETNEKTSRKKSGYLDTTSGPGGMLWTKGGGN